MRKYVHKLFAAFLSVCLLMSYNPSMGLAAPTDTGTVIDPDYAATYGAANDPLDTFESGDKRYQNQIDNALNAGGSDELTVENGVVTAGNGDSVSSSINIGTYNDGIETASSDVMFASIEDIRAPESLFTYVGVAATGGYPSDYRFTWEVYCDGIYQDTIQYNDTAILKKEPRADDPNVIISKFDLPTYSRIGLGTNPWDRTYCLENNHLYTFKCTVTDGHETVAAKPIYLYTVPNTADYDYYYKSEYAHSNDSSRELPGALNYNDVAIHSDLLFSKIEGKTEGALISATVAPEVDLTATELAAHAGLDAHEQNIPYMLTKVWQVSMESQPKTMPGTGGYEVPIEPFLTDKATLYLPFDNKDSYNKLALTASQYVGTYGDEIVVLWTDGSKTDGRLNVEELKGTIKIPSEGTPYVELPISPSSKYQLGNFAIRYVGVEGYNQCFEVGTEVSTKDVDGYPTDVNGGWFTPYGLFQGSTLTHSTNFFPGDSNVNYGIQLAEGKKEDGKVKTFYQLNNLSLKVYIPSVGYTTYVFVEEGIIKPGVNNNLYSYNGLQGVSATGQTATIKNGVANGIYKWIAEFREVDVNDAKDAIKFTAEVLSEKEYLGDDASESASTEKLGTLRLLYNDPTTGELIATPSLEEEKGVWNIGGSDGLSIRNNAQARLWMQPDNTSYDIKRIRVSNGDRYTDDPAYADEKHPNHGLYDPEKAGELFYTDLPPEQLLNEYALTRVMNPNAELHLQVYFGPRVDDSQVSKHTVKVTSNDSDYGGVWENGAFLSNPAEIEFIYGAGQQIALKGKDGYRLDKLELRIPDMSNPVPVPDMNDQGLYVYTLPAIDMDFEILATFVEDNNQHTITVEKYENVAGMGTIQSDAGGVVTPGTRTVATGETLDFQVIPNRGYAVSNVTLVDKNGNQFMQPGVDGADDSPIYSSTDLTDAAKNGGAVRLVAPAANSRLQVTFESLNLSQTEIDRKDTVTVTSYVKGGVGGTVVPNGATEVRVHDSYVMSFTPVDGYEVANIYVSKVINGVQQAADKIAVSGRTYVLPNVVQQYRIEVEFLPVGPDNPRLDPAPTPANIKVNVNSTGSGSGSWSPSVPSSGMITVPKGSSVPFSFWPGDGSVFKGAFITFTPDDSTEGVQQIFLGPNDSPYAILSGLSNGTIDIKVTFDDVNDDQGDDTRFALTTHATGEGDITPLSGTTLVGGSDQWINFVPTKVDPSLGNGYTLGDGSVIFDDDKLNAYYSPASATIRFVRVGDKADEAGVGEAPYASGTLLSECGQVAGTGLGMLESITNQGLGNYSLKLENVHSDITVNGSFVAAVPGESNGPDEGKLHRVDACVVEGIGTVTPGGTMRVQDGSSQTFVFKPIAGYKIVDVDISTGNFLIDLWNNLTSIFGANSAAKQAAIENGYYTVENIHTDIAVKVSFALDTGTSSDPGANLHPVTVLTDGANGTVSPSGVVLMERPTADQDKGETRTFVIDPNPGYTLAGVHVESGNDTVQVTTTTNSLEFTVTVLHGSSTASVIRVTFMQGAAPAPPELSGVVHIESSPNGVVSPVGTVDIPKGGSQTITAIPQTGYEIDEIIVTDSAGSHPLEPMIDVAGGSFVIGEGGINGGVVPSNIKVTFKPSSTKRAYYQVSAVVGSGLGTVSPALSTVPADKPQNLLIQPAPGYKIQSITDTAGSTVVSLDCDHLPEGADRIGNTYHVQLVKDTSGNVMDHNLVINFVLSGEQPDDKYIADTITVTSGKYGTGSDKGVLSPSEGSFEVEKGQSGPCMTFWTTDGTTPIFAVKVNGEEKMGLTEEKPLAGSKGSFILSEAYTNNDIDFGVYFGSPDPVEPTDAKLNVQVGGGGTGSVFIQGATISNAASKQQRSSATTGSGAAYGYGSDQTSITLPSSTTPMDLRIMPENGSQISKVLMTSNCKVVTWTPAEYQANTDISQTLTYTIQVNPNDVSEATPARVYIEFGSLSRDSYFAPTDAAKGDYVEDSDSYNADVSMSMEMDIQGDIADLVGSTGSPTDLLDLRLPANARQAGNNGTTITYTIPQDIEGLTFEVGPLIKLGKTAADSTLYTLDFVEVNGESIPDQSIHPMISANVSGVVGQSAALNQAMSQGTTVASFNSDGQLTEMPISQDSVDRALARAGENDTFYQYYTFDTGKLESTDENPTEVTVHLRKLSTDEGENGNYFVRNNESNTYNITTLVASGPESGSLSIWPTGPAVQRGQQVTVSWKPAEGYGLKKLTVGGLDVTGAALASGSGNFVVTADGNKQIVAEFVPDSELTYHTIRVSSQGNGSVKTTALNVTSGQTGTLEVQHLTSAVFTLVPDAGYKPAYVTLDGHRSEWTSYTYPLAGVDRDHTLVFEFARDTGSGVTNNGGSGSGDFNLAQTGLGSGVNSALSATGDHPWIVVTGLLVLIAVICGLVAMRMRRASATAANEAAQRRAYRQYRDYYNRRR